MSEAQTQYQTKNSAEIVRCQKCGMKIGSIGQIDGREYLIIGAADHIGGIAVTFMRGACTCGAEFYWSISERALAELIRRVMEMRTRDAKA